ncbi:MAG: hypothetical protein A3G41_07395 [Elusimicrobia bacterium RIFCSPLOWO2_12_FULL_59_9]|nr:MAG: hypothetical protein A3G41_07395 [Elusimicrobia bacterium RIFCSPLOWO2_12_FULL_59_9]
MAENRQFNRSVILIKETLQLKYVGLVFGFVLIAVLVVGIDLYWTMINIISRELPGAEPLLDKVQGVLLVKVILYLGICFLMSLIVSHRIAGPVYRFEKSAQSVATGDLTHRVSLRTGDELGELQDEFNRMVESLQIKLKEDRNALKHLSARLDVLSKKFQEDAFLQEIQALKTELQHITSGFKL